MIQVETLEHRLKVRALRQTTSIVSFTISSTRCVPRVVRPRKRLSLGA
jgi:hypothetical protein